MLHRLLAFPLLIVAAAAQAQNAVQVSAYHFQNNLKPFRADSKPLVAVDPSNGNSFVTDTVFGQQRTVYDIQGRENPKEAQGGLTYQGKDKTPRDNYSAEIVIKLPATAEWRKILDFRNRSASEGLYLDPSGWLSFNNVAGTDAEKITSGNYFHAVAVKASGTLSLYMNGVLAGFRTDTGPPGVGLMPALENPDQLVHILLGHSPYYWSSARVALFRMYSGALTAAEVKALAASPFTSTIGLPRPGFQPSGIVNSASFSADNAISPGALFTIFGNDLTDNEGTDWGQSFVNNMAPRRLNNTRVLINDQEAFVVFTSFGQVNALAPDNIPDGPVTVVVENGTLRSTAVASQARRINPAVFRFNPQDSKYLAATANDGSAYIGPANLFGTNGVLNGLALRPARPGEYVVLYGTGLGLTAPPVPAGQIPPTRSGGYPLSSASAVNLRSAGGQVTTVTPAYAGLTGFPGLHQVVFLVPDLPDGDYETSLAVAGLSSPAGTFLTIGR